MLAIYSKASEKVGESVEAIDECLEALEARPAVEAAVPESGEFEEILLSIGPEH